MPLDWSTACLDWEDRILNRRSLIPCGALFPQEAAAARQVLAELKIVDAPGSPRIGDAWRPWEFDFADAIFGAYDADSGRRLIQEYLLSVAKKNAKSSKAAAIMLTALILNWRLSGEFLIVAPTIEVANNSFGPARDMIRHDNRLHAMMHVQEHYRTITHRETKATLKVVAADNETVGGKKAIGVLVDELWLFGKRANAENMLREATGGLASRPEGFVIYLTTQSDDPPAGVFLQKLLYARGVRDGTIQDKRFLPVLYEFPAASLKADLHLDRRYYYVTNPNLGASVDEEFLDREYSKAKEGGPSSLAGFFAKHLNVEIGVALRSNRWAGADHWEARGDPALTLDVIVERSDVITVGIDGGGLDDLLGVAVLGRNRDTREWLFWTRAFANPLVLERRKSEAPRLLDFKKAGDLVIVDRLPEDIDHVADLVQDLNETGLLGGVGVDQIGIGGLIDALAERGIENEEGKPPIVIGVSQGWKLSGAVKTAERKLADGTMTHAAQPIMAWNVGNAKVEPRGNALTITKQTAGAGKIDNLIALFNACQLMAMNPEPRDPHTVYEERGLLVL